MRENLVSKILASVEKRIALKSEYVISGVNKLASAHILRHSLRAHLLEHRTDFGYIQKNYSNCLFKN
ncbi:MAG: hypothetical protein JXR48_06320 [Candidatus Delongbacteria bacterium]|nr:hypothetical protein [Candidatus Delongbacteria bacterium]